MARTTEAFSRVKIDALLADAGWNLTDGASVLFEHALSDGSRADYVLQDRAGRPMAVRHMNHGVRSSTGCSLKLPSWRMKAAVK